MSWLIERLFTGKRAGAKQEARRLCAVNAALRESEALRRAGYYGSPVPLHTLSPNGIILDVSDAWEMMMGYRRDEVCGRLWTDFMTPESHASHPMDYPALLAGRDLRRVQRTLLRRDGSLVHVEVSKRVEHADGRPYIICVVIDISEQREVERQLQETQAALAHAQKIEALGQLTGGVAHDFNNLLQAISGNVQLLKGRMTNEGHSSARLHRPLDNSLAACSKAAQLVQKLLTFARRQKLSPVLLNPIAVLQGDEGAQGMLPLIRASIGSSVELRWEIAQDVGLCHADPDLLESAVLNLINNARDAIQEVGEKGAITIAISTARLAQSSGPDQPQAGEYVRIAVRDTGPGIPPEIRERAFEPFQTTKDVGKGTGLGLAMVYGFARQSGGIAVIETPAGGGAEVAILLPRRGDLPRAAPTFAPRSGQVPAGAGERVLVVEDDELVRGALVLTLEDLGYEVIEAASADEAWMLLKGVGAQPEILLTDMAMPGKMDGLDLTRQVRETWPALPVVLMTGNLDPPRRDRLPQGIGFLSKPYQREDIASTVRALLDERALA